MYEKSLFQIVNEVEDADSFIYFLDELVKDRTTAIHGKDVFKYFI